jgi:hypothetical protein
MVASTPLVLDPAIRDWVLIPIVVIMFLMGILRNNVMKMLRKDTAPQRAQVQQNNQLMRSRRLRANAGFIPSSAFAARKQFFVNKDSGILMQKMEAPNPMQAMQDPSVMMNMMQGNFAMMVPQMVMMGIVNYFFSGFVLGARLPHPQRSFIILRAPSAPFYAASRQAKFRSRSRRALRACCSAAFSWPRWTPRT